MSSSGQPLSHGTGVFVTPNAILTAKHVVSPQNGADAAAPVIDTQWLGSFGFTRADGVLTHEDPQVDLAIVLLNSPKGTTFDNVAPVHKDPRAWINVGDRVMSYGFRAINQDVEPETLEIKAVHTTAGVYISGPAVPEGFSGGPVFMDGALVGVLYAVVRNDNRTAFYSGKALGDMLALLDGTVLKEIDDKPHALREYPLGPMVSELEVYASLPLLIDAYVRIFKGKEVASRALGIANAERRRCGPDSGTKGLVEPEFLPDIGGAPVGFWNAAFTQAGLKSPRMLASLLLVVEPDSLTTLEDQQRRDFLERLKTWRNR